ncbi:MAG: hypothetical protein MI919_37985 [Holophagales bacterium]|nr:hypothetical protein [Holophagales bacterium]
MAPLERWIGLVIVAATVSCAVLGGDPTDTEEVPEVEANPIAQLRSWDPIVAAEAFQDLYSEGRGAIPSLIGELETNSPFAGWCGRAAMDADTEVVEFHQLESIAQHGTGERHHLIMEAALYLIEAILRQDFYFADHCSILIEGRKPNKSKDVASRMLIVSRALSSLDDQAVAELTPQRLIQMREEASIDFPESRDLSRD